MQHKSSRLRQLCRFPTRTTAQRSTARRSTAQRSVAHPVVVGLHQPGARVAQQLLLEEAAGEGDEESRAEARSNVRSSSSFSKEVCWRKGSAAQGFIIIISSRSKAAGVHAQREPGSWCESHSSGQMLG